MILPRGSKRRETALTYRNAFDDFNHVASDMVLAGSDTAVPLVTIAIPTFRRLDLLVEAVQSCLAQTFERTFEIIIVDNDPASLGAHGLTERLPELTNRSFRYFVNRENLGMFGNFNRCIQLARGEWLTILNDDDLLCEEYLRQMFAVLNREPGIDGIVCRKGSFGRNHEVAALGAIRGIAKRLLLELFFVGRPWRRLTVDKFFWGALAGNIVGFLFRTSLGRQIGGFYPEEYPSDTWFYARFAKRYDLRQHRAIAARIRIGKNESANVETLRGFFMNGFRMQQTLAESDVPRWWRRFSPLILARDRADYKAGWGVDIPVTEVERMVNMKLTADRPYLLWMIRLFLRGF